MVVYRKDQLAAWHGMAWLSLKRLRLSAEGRRAVGARVGRVVFM